MVSWKDWKKSAIITLGLLTGTVSAYSAGAPKPLDVSKIKTESAGIYEKLDRSQQPPMAIKSCNATNILKNSLDPDAKEDGPTINVAPCYLNDEAKELNKGLDVVAFNSSGNNWGLLLNLNHNQYAIAGINDKIVDAYITNGTSVEATNGIKFNVNKKEISFMQPNNTAPQVKEMSFDEINKLLNEFLDTHVGWLELSGINVPFYNRGSAGVIDDVLYSWIDLPGINRQVKKYANRGISLGDNIGYAQFLVQATDLGSIKGKNQTEINEINNEIKRIFTANFNNSAEFKKIAEDSGLKGWKPENFNPYFVDDELYAIQVVVDNADILKKIKGARITGVNGEKGMRIVQDMGEINNYLVWPAFGDKTHRNYLGLRFPPKHLKKEYIGKVGQITPKAGTPKKEYTLEEKCAIGLETEKCPLKKVEIATHPLNSLGAGIAPRAVPQTVMPRSITSPVVVLLRGIGNNIGLQVKGGALYESESIKSVSGDDVQRSNYDGWLPVLDAEGVLRIPIAKGVYLLGRGGADWQFNGSTSATGVQQLDKDSFAWKAGGGIGYLTGLFDITAEGLYLNERASKSLVDGDLTADQKTNLDGFGIRGSARLGSKIPITLVFDYADLSGTEKTNSEIDLRQYGGKVVPGYSEYGIDKSAFGGSAKLSFPAGRNLIDFILNYQHSKTEDSTNVTGSELKKEEREQMFGIGAAYAVKIPGGDIGLMVMGVPYKWVYSSDRKVDEKYSQGVLLEGRLRFGGEGKNYLSD